MDDQEEPEVASDRDVDQALAASAIVEDENRELLERLAARVGFGDRQRKLSDETGARVPTASDTDRSEDGTSVEAMGKIEKWRGRWSADDRLTCDEANERT